MCGIAGIVGSCGPEAGTRLRSASRKLSHRGPDDHGYLCYSAGEKRLSDTPNDSVGYGAMLSHLRLSILDLTKSGRQPMVTADGRSAISFNGEIYNYIELRDELRRRGHSFRTQTDTEVLLAAYDEWGMAALDRLVGMFAFALLDTIKQEVLLVRDFFGIKPLYYWLDGDRLAFASELKALLELGAKARANPTRALRYLQHGVSDDGQSTFVAGISQVPAGHYLRVPLRQPANCELTCYWQPEVGRSADISFEEAAARVRDIFIKNVELHLRSDVPVGVALSGGIDSSSIAAAMRHVSPGLELHAFSYVADDSEVSEEKWIEIAASDCNSVLHKVSPGPDDLASDLGTLTYAQDHPFGSTSIYAQYCVFRAARQAGVTVMLDGQGADEIFGGYRFFLAARFASLVRAGKWIEAARFARRCGEWPGASSGWIGLRAMEYLLPQSLQASARKLVGKDPAPAWLNQAWFAERTHESGNAPATTTPDLLRETLRHTIMRNTLPGLLRYEDRNSMAFSIESRVPFLTPELVNFALSLPEDYLVGDDGTSKRVFRQAMRGLVPDAILDRRDKVGFATPERKWLRKLHPFVERVLQSEAAHIPCLNLDYARAEWDAIVSGRHSFSAPVWRWINLIEWTRRYEVIWS